MYQTSLFFKIKDTTALDKHRILELFFKSWVDDTCDNEVSYSLQEISSATCGAMHWEEVYRVDFNCVEDAVAIKLKGIPLEYQNYIEIIA